MAAQQNSGCLRELSGRPEIAPLVAEDFTMPQRAALQPILDPADGAGMIGLLSSRALERVAKGCRSKARKGSPRREGSLSEQGRNSTLDRHTCGSQQCQGGLVKALPRRDCGNAAQAVLGHSRRPACMTNSYPSYVTLQVKVLSDYLQGPGSKNYKTLGSQAG